MADNVGSNPARIRQEINMLYHPYLTKEQMQKLSTKRLLNYKRKYLSYNHYMYCSLCSGPCEETMVRNAKEISEWEIAHKNLKEVLATREHIEI